MRILTVRQPYAWAIIHGGKDVENRVRSLGPYRGPVAIHAGLIGASFDARHPELWPFDERHITGRVIGVVDLVDVHEPDWCDLVTVGHGATACSPWAQPDVHHLILTNPRPLATPIPAKGRLGLWRPDADLEAAIRDQLSNVPHDPTNEEKAL